MLKFEIFKYTTHSSERDKEERLTAKIQEKLQEVEKYGATVISVSVTVEFNKTEYDKYEYYSIYITSRQPE